MLCRVPYRFRKRALFAITLIGTSLLITLFYSAILKKQEPRSFQVRNFKSEDNSKPTSWWNSFLWSTTEKCNIRTPKPASGSVYTGDIFKKLDFSVPDNNNAIGFWNDVLENRYRKIKETWKDLPLEVIVVPHSHVDPGWLRTYDEYFDSSVNHILDNMVVFLNKTEEFKFIWAEISYFSKWWHNQDKTIQETVQKILGRKQLEVVTGGWVMTDEATTSYYAIIDQLVEGHQWLKHFTNVTPTNGWSVDVFGHSASLPYVLSSTGIANMVIMRAHYSWKAFLASTRGFDFYWDQSFKSPRILCHMAPSDLYSFKYTCGPDPSSCLNYDFRKIGGEMSESTAEFINNNNIELKANYLLAQYGRYASLFNHNVLMVPLGDDFRFNVYSEWEQQTENYKKLFRYINKRKDWNAHVRFGTVSDYFEKVHKRLQNISNSSLTSMNGDFLPYADIYANSRPSYWTGFYTTRPFYKKLSRELEHWLRTAEILYSFAKTLVKKEDRNLLLKDYSLLMSARQNHALFQHHDAITGTSRHFVMQDYGRRLHSGLTNAMTITSHIAQLLLIRKQSEGNTWTSQVYPDVYRTKWNDPTKQLSVSATNTGRFVIFFNPLATERTETVRIKVRTPNIKIQNSEGNFIPSQINPIWKEGFITSNILYELVFVIKMKPLSFSIYKLIRMADEEASMVTKSVVSLYLKDDSAGTKENSVFKFEKPRGEKITLESSRLRATFSSSGILKEIYLKDSGLKQSVSIDFKAYKPWIYRSGAYLFQPDYQETTPITNLTKHFPILYMVRGPIVSELNIIYSSSFKFALCLYHFESAPPGLEIEVSSDISKLDRDVELIMQVGSGVRNGVEFFTDSNGLQMLRRQYLSKLTVEANYYPATSSMFIEDKRMRLNLLLPHSHGVTSPFEGALEVMIDRRMRNDDGRGMSQGVEDNQHISTKFWLVPEAVSDELSELNSLSSETHLLSRRQAYPVITLMTDRGEEWVRRKDFSFLTHPWPSDVHLVNLRTLSSSNNYSVPSDTSLMVVFEKLESCKSKSFTDKVIENYSISSFNNVVVKSVIKTFLTGTIEFPEGSSAFSSLSQLQSSKVTFG